MNPADAAPVLRELSIQGEMLERHEKMMKHVVEEQTVLRQLVAELKGILLTPPGAAADAPSPGPSLSTHPLPAPEKFSGDLDKSRGFLTQCSFIFREHALVNVCIQLDEHRHEFGRRPAGGSKTSAGPSLEWRREWEEQPLEEEQPMQIGRASFRSVARRRRPQGGECFTCGKRGHFSDKCPESGKDAARQ
uniref:CCHC-type domain-containing protein n=1 Tax=Astatotilapia calliptera TaxID=8154 RepID=A0AAX7UXU1_ASTCA